MNIFGLSTLSASVVLALTGLYPARAGATDNPVIAFVQNGECAKAVELVNHAIDTKDSQALFWGGRMLDEGICVDAERAAAARFYERSAELGDRRGTLEYAAAVGQGVYGEQSFDHAGEICHAAGIGSGSAVSLPSLGYACTVGAVASRLIREAVPAGSFRVPTDPVRVAFRPASGQLSILGTPQVTRDQEENIGSHLRKPRVNINKVTEDAWRRAVDKVPKPKPALSDDTPVELALDVELSLENGANAADRDRAKLGPDATGLNSMFQLRNITPAGQKGTGN